MAKKKKPVAAAPQVPPPVNPLGVKSVYANNMELQMSGMDARLIFNEIIAESTGLSVERRAHVVMAIPHLKAMMEVLDANIRRTEVTASDPAKGTKAEQSET